MAPRHDISSTVALVGGFVALVAIFQVARIVYQIFAGPYSKYPGPKIAKVSRLPWLYHKLQGNADKWVVKLHEQYGDIVQPAPAQLSFATGQAWKDIYGFSTGGKTQQFPKCDMFYGNRPPGVADIIYSKDVDHTRIRRNFAHAFSDRALREQEPMLQQYIDELITKLGQHDGKPLDLVRWYNYTTFDIMADLAFGAPLGNLSGGEYTPWVAFAFKSIKTNTYLTEMKYFPLLKPFMNILVPTFSALKRERAQHWANCRDQVDKRLAREDSRPDIWEFVINAKEKQQLTVPEMYSSSQVLMVAGTETTATLLSGLTYLLLTNPDKMQLVKKEVRERFSSSDQINIDTVLQLKYINACFEEALRCYPPVATGLPRVIPTGGDNVCGHHLPGGTQVSVHQQSTNRNPRNFHRATEFLPERFLDAPEFAHDDKTAFQPFSFGPRNCLGKNLAYLEMRLIFANVIWHYDVNLCEQSRNWVDQKTYLLWEKHPLMVTLDPVVREKVDLMS